MRDVKTRKTTKKDFKVFETEARRWADIYAIGEWCLEYRHSDEIESPSMADSSWVPETQVAYIRLAKEIDVDGLTDNPTLEEAARHEIDHIVLAEANDLLGRYYSEDYVGQVIHRIIYRLENARKQLGIV